MQDLMVVGFIVDDILRVGFKNDKVTRARNICQGHKVNVGAESGHRRGHMQGLMVVGFIVDEILRVGFKNDKVTRARNIGQGH